MNNLPQINEPSDSSSQDKGTLNWYKRQGRGTKVGIGSFFFVVLALCVCLGGFFVASQSSAYASSPTVAIAYTSIQASVRGVNNNPWGYNFTKGHLITRPPSRFCSYFRCISSFWKGRGYVVECRDSQYSLSGGRRGACSYHRGVWRTLYSH